MGVSRWFYDPDICEGRYCCGDCDYCDIQKNPEKYGKEYEDDEDIEEDVKNLRKGFE